MQHCEPVKHHPTLHHAARRGLLASAVGALALLMFEGVGWAVIGGVAMALMMALTDRVAAAGAARSRDAVTRDPDGGTASSRQRQLPSQVLHTQDGGSFERAF
jgi:hypothetical protein